LDLNPRKIALKTVMSLPSPLLRAMSGGHVVWRGGRTLDPRLQYLAGAARRGPAFAGLTPEEMRLQNRAGLALTAGSMPHGVSAETLHIDGPGGALPLRVYRPASVDPAAPLLVFAHMGGVAGAVETSEGFCGLLANTTRGVVLSVDYRLAPEHRFPAGLEDVTAAYRWARDNAERFGATQAAIGGDSIGGGFAAAICQTLKSAGEAQPAYQLLVYPLLDAAGEGPAMTTYADAWPLSKPDLEVFVSQYLGPDADPGDLRVSPLRAEDLAGLAPAVIVQAGFDATGDQPLTYARRLRTAGVPVAFRAYDNLAHGFVVFAGVVPAAEAACREIADLARRGFAEESAAGH
jgi:acetyl esterase/lipase